MTEDINMEMSVNKRTVGAKILLTRGDITELSVDAMVNAAHEQLTGGGGVDGAIHRAAGPKLLGECLNLYGCPVGEARITGGYDLKAKYVIHTVGPVFSEKEKPKCLSDLELCYNNCLTLASKQGLKSIAFPCISTGAFCFPKDIAADIAMNSLNRALHHICHPEGTYLDEVTICCFDDENFEEYKKIFSYIGKSSKIDWVVAD